MFSPLVFVVLGATVFVIYYTAYAFPAQLEHGGHHVDNITRMW